MRVPLVPALMLVLASVLALVLGRERMRTVVTVARLGPHERRSGGGQEVLLTLSRAARALKVSNGRVVMHKLVLVRRQGVVKFRLRSTTTKKRSEKVL